MGSHGPRTVQPRGIEKTADDAPAGAVTPVHQRAEPLPARLTGRPDAEHCAGPNGDRTRMYELAGLTVPGLDVVSSRMPPSVQRMLDRLAHTPVSSTG